MGQVEGKLGYASFRSRQQDTTVWEYWAGAERPQLTVWFVDEKVVRLDGGIPEVDGVNALTWDIDKLKRELGSPGHAGLGGERGGSGHDFLAYPNFRLLIQRENGINRFILFQASGPG